VIELLLVRAIERFRSQGAQIVSLGMVAWADTRQEMTPLQRQLASFVTDRLHLVETRQTLFRFKEKFHPCWESRYVVASTTLGLPKVALAVLRVRNYSAGGLVRLIK
jgi:phosphatidylglycerol lysyltransferase